MSKKRYNLLMKGNKIGFIALILNINISILFSGLIQEISNIDLRMIESKSSYIILKIRGIGYSNIFFNNTKYFKDSDYPNEIYINNVTKNKITYKYYFSRNENFVKLIWNNEINNVKLMFAECSNITEIDLSNFKTSQIINMDGMFRNCSSLISLNLTNFDTSQVSWMEYTFSGCSSLNSLDLSNFNFPKTRMHMQYIFSGCKNLEFINLKSFNQLSLSSYTKMFEGVPENVVVCSNNSQILNELKNKKCKTLLCNDNWQLDQIKMINQSFICINNDINNNKFESYFTCPSLKLSNKDLCSKCSKSFNYYPIESDYPKIEENIYCSKEIKGYYLDNNESLYKKCFDSCESCEIKGDNTSHNCLKFKGDFPFQIQSFINNYTNCYNKCSYYHYFDNDNIYHCIKISLVLKISIY